MRTATLRMDAGVGGKPWRSSMSSVLSGFVKRLVTSRMARRTLASSNKLQPIAAALESPTENRRVGRNLIQATTKRKTNTAASVPSHLQLDQSTPDVGVGKARSGVRTSATTGMLVSAATATGRSLVSTVAEGEEPAQSRPPRHSPQNPYQ